MLEVIQKNQFGGYGYVVKNKKGKMILEFCATMKMTVGNTP